MYYTKFTDTTEIKELKSFIETNITPIDKSSPLNGIVSKKGVDNIFLNKTTAYHVAQKYGKAYDLYDVNGNSIEMKYDLLYFSCFFGTDNLDMKIFAVRLWKEHDAFQRHCKEFFRPDSMNTTLQDVFECYRTDVEYKKWYDDTYFVDFGFYRYHFYPPDYDGQDASSLAIESITIVQNRK